MKGTIIRLQGGFYDVMTETKVEIRCRARGNFRNRNISPVVGDDVDIQDQGDGTGYIMAVDERSNHLVRPPIANIDQAFLLFSVKEPAFSFHLLDRFLILIESKQVHPIIVLTKMDLLLEAEKEKISAAAALYRSIGYQVIETSTEDGAGIELIRSAFKDKTSVFAGQTGVGKSSLLNAVAPELELATGKISKALGRGKHTTRHVTLITLADGFVADTPGFSSLEFPEELEVEEMRWCFPEFVLRHDDCKFRGCAHLNEPGCAVKAAVEAGEIASTRYANYVTFMEELKDRQRRY
ncbi:ribosome small subunit-dependent GTPase A [Exiguobacterium sp. SH3S2]|uniref:ribosome small subunit-dependent GTPase A n=1 Tax=Exiguobacterium TaxID=33986 RepID=UPI0008776F34|nr:MULTISPECIES: ribosome small subunit-dependent GTPase A [Exiguobacterium]OGX78017.1 ribosome small subunit-dependent GTPase A [Exiguobacterium sp. SH31]TCI27477.1 ribosome small subunit-dependent GTPase A [Exiguobacterium sp. SH5S4]TCI37393.1 ribosome small subunit-dependent GTPase A [Exiguobacterium sp. SH4S7]TCI45524.1 ribosome small subunit-dependent GTPase A [Exiguobacterium sp. SH5S32]TCI49200.1 ribosome small subunit-dependent GTPase A [Exiguobacterium sp. SH3S3]